MGYTRTTWQDHVKDANGNVIQQGTPVNAANLNNIENGIAGATGIKTFAASTAYAVADVMVFENKIYRCKTAHTSSSSATAPVGAFWDIISSSGSMKDWEANKNYSQYDAVIYQGQIYRCAVATSNSATFNTLQWTTVASNINDSTASSTSTYSSQKIDNTFVKGTTRIWVQQTQPLDADSKNGDLWIW